MMHTAATLVKAAAGSRPNAVAGAIAGIVRGGNKPVLRAIGAPAVNQAVKAIAVARSYLELGRIDMVCIPFFSEVQIDGEERTAVDLTVEAR